MQQFKSAIKKYLPVLKKIAHKFFDAANNFCKNVIPSVFSYTVKYLKKSPRVLAAIITVILVISCTVTVAVATNTTSAYAVVHNGEIIAMIKEPSVLAEAENFAANKLNNPDCISHLIKAELTQTLVGEDNLIGSVALAECIINHSNDISVTNVLKVDGNIVSADGSDELIKTALKNYLADYKQKNVVDNVEFSNNTQISNIYLLKSKIAKLPCTKTYLESAQNSLSVQTVSTVVAEEEIPFDTVTTNSDSLSVGSKKIAQKGVKGCKEVTYKVYSLNGVETKRIAVSEKVVANPVSQKVIVGTKRVVISDKNENASMCWPIKRVERSYVSSYVGDGRGHKGMDIVAPGGTPIYAATGGTVTFSGWDTSGYGYKILIKHANGYETLYAHCSALYVKKGDTVAMGETIGAVGTTGRSTGNHLHFEVHLNGRIKDPANYIGRK